MHTSVFKMYSTHFSAEKRGDKIHQVKNKFVDKIMTLFIIFSMFLDLDIRSVQKYTNKIMRFQRKFCTRSNKNGS